MHASSASSFGPVIASYDAICFPNVRDDPHRGTETIMSHCRTHPFRTHIRYSFVDILILISMIIIRDDTKDQDGNKMIRRSVSGCTQAVISAGMTTRTAAARPSL